LEGVFDVGNDGFVIVESAVDAATDTGGFLVGKNGCFELGEVGIAGGLYDDAEIAQQLTMALKVVVCLIIVSRIISRLAEALQQVVTTEVVRTRIRRDNFLLRVERLIPISYEEEEILKFGIKI